MLDLILKICLILLLMMFGAFFAGTETGVYRLSRLKLRIMAEQGKRRYQLLLSIMRDGQGLILSLLIGNNLVNYFITSLATVIIFNRVQDFHLSEIYTTSIITPVMFIFCEIVPKNIFYYKANTLVPRLAWLNWFFFRLFTWSGIVGILKALFRSLTLLFRLDVDTAKAVDVTQRHQVHQIIYETQEEGLLSDSQRDMMSRLIDTPGISIDTVMIKLNRVEMVSVNSDYATLLNHLKNNGHTRQIVYENQRDNIIGFIPIYDILGKNQPFENLNGMITPLLEIDRGTSVIEAINLLRNEHAKIALVVEKTKKHKKAAGIVTVADLTEELTGELNP